VRLLAGEGVPIDGEGRASRAHRIGWASLPSAPPAPAGLVRAEPLLIPSCTEFYRVYAISLNLKRGPPEPEGQERAGG
jgi:hypothetical protein